MAGTLYLRLNDAMTSWLSRGPAGDAFAEGPLEQAAAQAAGSRVVVLVPAADVVLTQAHVPAKQSRHLRQAIPYAVEEQLSDDVERLHFALASQRGADGSQPVAVVSRARMQEWIARLDAAGVAGAVMVPESLALPWSENEWTLLVDGEGALLRTGPTRGYGLEADDLATLLAIAIEQAGEGRPARLRLFNGGLDTAPVHELCSASQVTVAEEAITGGRLAALAGPMADAPTIDLFQGDFSRRENLGKLWRPWRYAAALLGVWVLLQAALGGYHYVTLSRELARLETEIEQVYRQAFPEARSVTDARAQMEQHLKQLRGGSGGGPFVSLMAKAAPVLRGARGFDLGALRYKDGALEVEFSTGDFQAVDGMKQALAAKQLQVEVQNASARGGKTQGVLRVREAR